MYRRDRYHLYPWGRGDKRYSDEIAEIYSSVPVWMAWGALEVPETGHKYLGDYQLDMLDFFRDHPKKLMAPWFSRSQPV